MTMPFYDNPRTDVTRIKVIGLQQHMEVRELFGRALNTWEEPPPWALALYDSITLKVERLTDEKKQRTAAAENGNNVAVNHDDGQPESNPGKAAHHSGQILAAAWNYAKRWISI